LPVVPVELVDQTDPHIGAAHPEPAELGGQRPPGARRIGQPAHNQHLGARLVQHPQRFHAQIMPEGA
jgi:hypothetical protein